MFRTVVGASVLVAFISYVHASPFHHHGMGARASALGAAFTAVRGDFASVYYNPAGLTGSRDVQVGIGVDLVVPQLKFLPETNRTTDSFEANYPSGNASLHAAALFPILSKYDNPIALGIGISLPLTNATRIEASSPETPQFYRYDAISDSYGLVVGLAGRPHRWFSLGVGMHLLGGIDGAYDIELDLIRRRFTREEASAVFEHAFAWSVGLNVHPSQNWSLGLSYRSQLQLNYRLDNQTKLTGVADFDIQGFGEALYVPPRLALGFRWMLTDDVMLTGDLLWERWSEAGDPSAQVVARIDATDLGLEEALFTNRMVNLGAKDTLSPRAGAEWHLQRWVLRAGYAFLPTALPAQTASDNYADSDVHQFSFGFGMGWGSTENTFTSAPMTLEWSAQSLVMEKRQMDKSSAMDPVGDYSVKGVIWYSGLTMRHRF